MKMSGHQAGILRGRSSWCDEEGSSDAEQVIIPLCPMYCQLRGV